MTLVEKFIFNNCKFCRFALPEGKKEFHVVIRDNVGRILYSGSQKAFTKEQAANQGWFAAAYRHGYLNIRTPDSEKRLKIWKFKERYSAFKAFAYLMAPRPPEPQGHAQFDFMRQDPGSTGIRVPARSPKSAQGFRSLVVETSNS